MEAVIRQAGLERTAVPVKKKQIGSVDICKGIAMIYVIIVHFFPGAMGLSTAKTMNAFSGSWGWEQVVGMVLVMILCGLYAALVRKLKSVRLQRKEAV